MAQTLDQQGNVIVNGYSTNLTPEQYTRYYGGGANQSNQTINTYNMAPSSNVTPPTYTPYNYNNNYANSTLSLLASDYGNLNSQLDQARADQKALAESRLSLESALMGRTYDSQAFQDQTGATAERANLTKYAQQLADLNAQASSLNREAQAIPIQNRQAYQGTSGTESQVKNVNYDQLQQNALKALSIGQQADVAAAAATGSQLRLQSAVEKAQQMVDLKYKPIEDQIAIKKEQYELNKDILTQLDAKRTEALNAAIKKEEAQIAEQKENEKGIADLVTNAAVQGAPADIRDRASKAKTPMEAANILGVYAGDYLKNELLKEQINKMRADTDKTRSEIVKIDNQASLLRAQPTGVVTAPNGDAIGIPNETLAAIGRLKLNEGQANAVAFTSRMIQAAKAIDSQLGTVNPTGGFYETTGYDPTSAGSAFGRFANSDQSRVYNTNSSDFIRAKLRKESGATITPEEMSADAAIYTPYGAGLDEKDLLLAQVKRDEAIKSMIAQAGPAAPYLQQYYEQSKSKNYDYDPYLDDTVIPSLRSSYNYTTSSSAYANSLLNR